jgi:hypothetical protein
MEGYATALFADPNIKNKLASFTTNCAETRLLNVWQSFQTTLHFYLRIGQRVTFFGLESLTHLLLRDAAQSIKVNDSDYGNLPVRGTRWQGR